MRNGLRSCASSPSSSLVVSVRRAIFRAIRPARSSKQLINVHHNPVLQRNEGLAVELLSCRDVLC